MAVIQMSERELIRLRVLIDLADNQLTAEAAGTLMGMGRRQVYRLRMLSHPQDRRRWSRGGVVVRAIAGIARRFRKPFWPSSGSTSRISDRRSRRTSCLHGTACAWRPCVNG